MEGERAGECVWEEECGAGAGKGVGLSAVESMMRLVMVVREGRPIFALPSALAPMRLRVELGALGGEVWHSRALESQAE